MKDDYLWDGTGDPDSDIQRLEQSLGRFRYQPEPLKAAFDRQLLPRRTNWWRGVAVAAAIILMVLVGVRVLRNQHRSDAKRQIAASTETPQQAAPQPEPNAPEIESPQPKQPTLKLAQNRKPARRTAPSAPREVSPRPLEPEEFDSAPGVSELAVVQPIVIPFVDPETSKHIERSQILLRSFRNMDDTNARNHSEIDYEKRQSRSLLYQNIVLRRDAQAKGNLPVEDLLGSLEPFLIDIANLPDKPSRDDVRAIKERMQKKEIVSTLQIYSAPTLSQVFK